MTAPRTILFATDFSGGCDRAGDRAARLARGWGARLVLLHVLPDRADTPEEHREELSGAEARLQAEVQDNGLLLETRVMSGEVASAILDTASDCDADLIVMGASHRDELGDFLVGTSVERVARRASAPLLIVKERTDGDYRQLMAMTDFSECSRTALLVAAGLFPTAAISLVHAYHVRLEGLRGREGPAAVQQADIAWELDAFLADTPLPDAVRERLDVNVDYGDVRRIARDHAMTNAVDLAVIGTHGRSALVAAVMGSTARALVGCLDCDILLVPQHGGPSRVPERDAGGDRTDPAGQ